MGWTRRELKARAKDVLRTSYWKAFVVSLILLVVGGGLNVGGNFSFNNSSSDNTGYPLTGGTTGFNEGILAGIIIFSIIVFIVVFVVILAFVIFLLNPLQAGATRYFKRASEQDVNMGNIVYSFDKTRYLDIVKSMIWAAFLNFLWFLLLYIPGIVKAYAYRMVPFILGDNPNIGYKRAVDLSNQMTRGHKWRMFVLDLSFIGWFLLGCLALFIGVIFVYPYYYTVQAELYLALRQEALERGLTTEEELRMEPTPPVVFE